MDKDRFLAEKVMGWEYKAYGHEHAYLLNSVFIMGQDDWHPTKDIEQAFECLNKIKGIMDMGRGFPDDTDWWCEIGHTDETSVADTPEMAICDAIIVVIQDIRY